MKYRMTKNALETYGQEWKNIILIVTHTASRYMPIDEFIAKGEPSGYHPGYDAGCGGKLYDLKRADNGEELPMSLYNWELERV